jgi:hypothetical protein
VTGTSPPFNDRVLEGFAIFDVGVVGHYHLKIRTELRDRPKD